VGKDVSHSAELNFSKPVVIINRRAGAGKAERQWQEIHASLARCLGGFTTLETERPGHAETLTRRALQDGFDRIVVVGGDGTYSEAVNGFFAGEALINPAASLAIVCAGTASDLARSLRLPCGTGAADRAGHKATLRADVIRVRLHAVDGTEMTRHFINVAHVGLGGEVARRSDKVPRALGGHLAYFYVLIGALFAYRPRTFTVTVDGERHSAPCMDVIVANGAYDGGGMHVAPQARLDSGHMDVLFIAAVSRLKALRSLHRLYAGTLHKHPDVTAWKAKRLRIEASEPTFVNLDGECPGMLPVEMEVLPGVLSLVEGGHQPA
jgi:YegS/Rv2252/BmrU family lipid kinase